MSGGKSGAVLVDCLNARLLIIRYRNRQFIIVWNNEITIFIKLAFQSAYKPTEPHAFLIQNQDPVFHSNI